MNRNRMMTIGIATVCLGILGGLAISAQDKYSVKVPGGLAFSDFRGYEGWQAIAMSRNDNAVAMILGNPAMIGAYRAGIPGNGQRVPDGAKMAKVHWKPKPNAFFSGTTVPGDLLNVDFMEKDSKRFADSGGLGMGSVRLRRRVRHLQARHDSWHAAARERRQARIHVSHESEGERLRVYGVRKAVK